MRIQLSLPTVSICRQESLFFGKLSKKGIALLNTTNNLIWA